jgi:flagellar protein FliJ
MKKHVWRLQRVLDVRIKQEEARKAQLLEVTQRLLAARQAALAKQAMMRSILLELAQKDAVTRMQEQPTVVRHMAFSEQELRELKKKTAEIEVERKRKSEELMEARKARKAMEKLQERAKAEYVKLVNAAEQKDLDELAGSRFVRSVREAAAIG